MTAHLSCLTLYGRTHRPPEYRVVAAYHDQVLALVDPEPLLRECLADVLQAEFPQTFVLAGAEVGEISPATSTPVVLGLLRVPSPYTLGTVAPRVKAFEQHLPRTPVVVIGCESERFAREAIDAGARGVLPVTEPLGVAMAAIRLVAAGGTYYPRCYLSEVLSSANAEKPAPSLLSSPLTPGCRLGANQSLIRLAPGHLMDRFTPRELEVIGGLQRGRSNKWIASQLNLSENTVKVHIRHIMKKLKAANRVQVVLYLQGKRPEP
jgi:DNA-binding NarL/FixJ family response regulator